MTHPKRLIEVDLPIARISAHARREKSIRHGHISTLHIWWARRPLAACRAVVCASLWPDPADPLCPPEFRTAAARVLMAFARRFFPDQITQEEKVLKKTASTDSLARWESLATSGVPLDPGDADHQLVLRNALLDFIADFANWDHSTVPAYLETSRRLSGVAHGSLSDESLELPPADAEDWLSALDSRLSTLPRPLVVDPFAGGGSIPLEALRVGADAFASDLNPVAVLLNKVVLEYIPKYGQRLADEVRKWGQWVKERAEEELAEFYPKDPDGSTPIAYLWARTIISEAPGEEVPIEVPMLKSFWLCKKPKRQVALRWKTDRTGAVETSTEEVKYADGTVRTIRRPTLEVFCPDAVADVPTATVARGSVTCPVTGYTTAAASVRGQLSLRAGGASDARLYCVAILRDGERGRQYRLPTPTDLSAIADAKSELLRREEEHRGAFTLVPDEPTPRGGGRGAGRAFSQRNYGMQSFANLYTPRQLLSLTTIASLVCDAGSSCKNDVAEPVQACLTLSLGKLADLGNSLCAWEPIAECPRHLFGRQAIQVTSDFAEGVVPGESSGSWSILSDRMAHVLDEVGSDWRVSSPQCGSAYSHVLPDESANVLLTDPPYYDAVPYADLSDFFYVWMKRALPAKLQSLFRDRTSPKDDECIVDDAKGKDESYFEDGMTRALAESRRTVEPTGIGVVVFAHKSTGGWESMLKAVIDAGWVITGSWPIDTEMGSRLRAMNSAALASSVHIVCRPRENPDGSLRESVGEWRDVLSELPKRIHDWMPRLAKEGVVGADAIFACLGPALEIFSRYSRVEKASGEPATLREYLEHVWGAVSTEALSLLFKDADAAGLEPDARLTAMWLWTLGAGAQPAAGGSNGEAEKPSGKEVQSTGYTLEFDAARKIAQGLGVHLEECTSFVEVKGDKARLLPVFERTRHLFGKQADEGTGKRKKKAPKPKSLFDEINELEAEEEAAGSFTASELGATSLDRVHQSMILFAAGRGEALKRFLVDDGAGSDSRFWSLAQTLSYLYPPGTDEKRWVDGVLARKKGLGL